MCEGAVGVPVGVLVSAYVIVGALSLGFTCAGRARRALQPMASVRWVACLRTSFLKLSYFEARCFAVLPASRAAFVLVPHPDIEQKVTVPHWCVMQRPGAYASLACMYMRRRARAAVQSWRGRGRCTWPWYRWMHTSALSPPTTCAANQLQYCAMMGAQDRVDVAVSTTNKALASSSRTARAWPWYRWIHTGESSSFLLLL